MFPWGVVPIFLPLVYYSVLILKFNKIIYKAVGDMLPADASFRFKSQKGCTLLSGCWTGGTKCFHIHICFFSTMLEGFGGRPCWGGGVVFCFFFNFLQFALLAKVCNSHIVYHVSVSKYAVS